ncbi:MAG: carbon-nitrogen hydrolase family protein [Spirochaetes bacterium]|nr:MAG: carbon-nitrogen hydrolase family protein [Spirochaetota bacterium]
MKAVRIVLCQMPLGETVTHIDAAFMREYRPHFVCFPEYFFVNRRLGNHAQTPHNFHRQHTRLAGLSRCLNTIVIGGSMPEQSGELLYNTSFVYDRGRQIGFYRKQNLFFAEEGKITPGTEFGTFQAYGITFGVLICADVFRDESFLEMKRRGAGLVFIPTFSPHREETMDDKFARDNAIFVRGARLSGAVIVKVCGVKSEYRTFLQARSLVAGEQGVIYRVRPDQEEKRMLITCEVEVP